MNFVHTVIILLLINVGIFVYAEEENAPTSIKISWNELNYGKLDDDGKIIIPPRSEMDVVDQQAATLWKELQTLLKSKNIEIDNRMTQAIRGGNISFSPLPILVSATFGDDKILVIKVGESYVIDPTSKVYRGDKECMLFHEKLRKLLHTPD